MLRHLCFAFALAAPAAAADLTVTVTTSAGQPVREAVVMAYPASGAPAPKIAGPYVLAQQNIQFDPFVLVVPSGATVTFPNKDKVRHHVYSFSPVKKFELKLYGREEARTVAFDKAGTIPVGCNIHDQMSAFIKAVDTGYAAKTGADGRITLAGLPAGPARLVIWHPYLRAPKGETMRQVIVPAAGLAQKFAVELRGNPQGR